MITEFGGAVAVPKAVRNSDSTTTMRVNDVIMIRIDGAIDNIVSSAINWIARSVTPPPPWPPRLMLMSCANAGSVSDPAVVIRAARKNTLRGNAAGLTKSSLDGRARTPFRLRDFQSRSSAVQLRGAGPRCALDAPRAAIRAPRAARRRRLRGGATRPPADAPSRRGFGRRSIAPEVPAAGAREAAAVPRRALPRAPAAASAVRPRAADASPARCVAFAAGSGRGAARAAAR